MTIIVIVFLKGNGFVNFIRYISLAQITALDPNVIRKQVIITTKVIITTRPCFSFRKAVTGTFF